MDYKETKTQKIKRISNLLNTETKKATNSIDNWHNYLNTASKFYKYSFTDQILISSQNPNAELCADYNLWKKNFGRYVQKSEKGIPLLYEENGRKKIRYVFDISSTRELENAKEVKVWKLISSQLAAVNKNIAEKNNLDINEISDKNFGKIFYHEQNFADIVKRRIDTILENSGDKYIKNIINHKNGTNLEKFDNSEIEDIFNRIAKYSIRYVAAKRCGFEPNLSDKYFENVTDFNSAELINQLGKAVSEISGTVLREIEREVKTIEKEIERSNNYERYILTRGNGREITADNGGRQNGQNSDRLQPDDKDAGGRGISEVYGGERSDIRTGRSDISVSSDAGAGRGGRIRDGNVGTAQTGISEKRGSGNIRNTDDKWSLGTSDTDGQSGLRNGGQADGRNDESRERDGGTQTNEPDGMGRQSEQHQEQSKGDNLQRTDLHLENTSEKAEDINSPAFSFAQNSDLLKVNELITQANKIYSEIADNLKDQSIAALLNQAEIALKQSLKTSEKQVDEKSAEKIKNDFEVRNEPNIIGNTTFKYISKKAYRKLDNDVALKAAEEFEKANIKYSGKYNDDNTITLTFSGADKDKCDDIIKNVQTANSFTAEQLETVRKTNLVDYLKSRGEQLKRVGSEYTMPEHDSMRIKENKFFWNSQNTGGNALDFCMKYYNMDFQNAVTELLAFNGHSVDLNNKAINMRSDVKKQSESEITANNSVQNEHNPFPNELTNDKNKVMEYLHEIRGISDETINDFLKKDKIGQDIKGNAVFKIFDKDGNISGAEISGTSPKRYEQTTEQKGNGFSFYFGKEIPKKAVFFESAIDLMSFYDMDKETAKDFLLVSMAGLKDKVVLKTAEDYGISKDNCFIASDYDKAGRSFADKMQKEYGISTLKMFDEDFEKYNSKDWNDLLRAEKTDLQIAAIHPLYKDSIENVREKGEFDLWRESHNENIRCRNFISDNYGNFHNDNIFDSDAFADSILKEFSLERAMYIVARNVSDYDGRYSKKSKEESLKYRFPYQSNEPEKDLTREYIYNVHPVLANALFETLIDRKRELEIQKNENEKSDIQENANKVMVDIDYTENHCLDNFIKNDNESNSNIPFALANSIFKYLDKKMSIEYDGGYDKTSFTIQTLINGDNFEYDGRFDIGDCIEDDGSSIIYHIKSFCNYQIERNPYRSEDSIEKAKFVLENLIPVLEKNTALTEEETRIFENFKKKYPIINKNINDKEQPKTEKSDIVKALENGQTIYLDDTPIPMIADAGANYFSSQKVSRNNDGTFKAAGKVSKGLGIPQDFEFSFDSAEKAENYIKSGNVKFHIEPPKQDLETVLNSETVENENKYRYEITQTSDAYSDGENFAVWDNENNDYYFDEDGTVKTFETEEETKDYLNTLDNYIIDDEVVEKEDNFQPQNIINAVDKILANHNFNNEERRIITRTGSRMTANKDNILKENLFDDVTFKSGYGGFENINKKYFNNNLKDIISEFNVYLNDNTADKNIPQKMTAENLKIGDVIKLPDIIWNNRITNEKTVLPSEYGVIRDIQDGIIDIQTYSDINLQNVSGRMGETISNIARKGFEYIGTETEIKNSQKESKQNFENGSKINAESLKIGDVVNLSPIVLIGTNGKEIEFPAEYSVITDIDSDMISFQTYSDKKLQNKISKSGQTISSLNRNGFEYIGTEEEIRQSEIQAEKGTENEHHQFIKNDIEKTTDNIDRNENNNEKPAELRAGDIIAYDGTNWEVKNIGFIMNFENIDKNSNTPSFSFIGGAEEFIRKHNFTLVSRANEKIIDKNVQQLAINIDLTSDKSENSAKEKHIKANEITLGDKFIYKDKEVEVTSLQGIYPGEVGISIKYTSDNIRYITTENVSRQNLVSLGEYLGNINKPVKEEKNIPQSKIVNAENFRITDDQLGVGTPNEKYRNNINAVKTLITIENENRQATPEEQEILSKYIGWGGLPDVFDERKSNWLEKYGELKELLTEEEYTSARSSVLNAHYTSPTVIKAIYKGLENLGFKGGRILEPSMGVGNFFGCMPENLSDKTKLYGVELDSISGRIAKLLYPKSNIQIKGFEKTNFQSNFFDAAIGNVPFGDYRVNDNNFKSSALIHDFFFQKSLDKVKPGGVIAFITSKGTLDKKDSSVRKYLAERADLLGAVRLPNEAFKANAGTDATFYDIVFLQKKDRISDFTKEPMPSWVNLSEDKNGIMINNYFVEHPEMICGEMITVTGAYGPKAVCKGFADKDFSEILNSAVSKIKGKIAESELVIDDEQEKPQNSNIIPQNYRNFCYAVIDGKIYFRENENMIEKNFNKIKTEKIKLMVNISESLRNLINAQKEFCDDNELKKLQAVLNVRYNNFTNKFGLLSDKNNKSVFREDDTSALLLSLENINDKGEFIGKADIFTKRTIIPYVPIEHVDTSSEALIVSISERAKVDLDFMSQLCGKEKEEIIEDLKGVIFKNPRTKEYENADEYLSGNIREKLETAKFYAKENPEYEINVSSLTEVIPPDLSPSEISVQLGSVWVPAKYYEQFMYELLGTANTCRSDYPWKSGNPFESGSRGNRSTISLSYDPHTATYGISNKVADRSNLNVTQTYGTKRMNAYKIIEETLNMKPVKVMDYVEDAEGKKKAVLNQKETLLAQEKQNIIKNKFEEWIFNDPERTEDLCRIYNDNFNSIRPREYDGSHITFGGINPEITLGKHQVDAIAHTLYGGNTLLAHTMGAGKTFEMVASAMESKRLGLCTKSMLVVPKHIINQVANEFLQLYPTANILLPSEKDFSKENRERFCSRIATGNYDAIIISHTQLEKIPLSQERQIDYIQNEIDETIDFIESAKAEAGQEFTVKQLESTKRNLETKLEKLNNDSKRDTTITFEELGIDRLYVDEAHIFKNKFFNTKMGRNIAGINASSASQRAEDLAMKCQYLDELTGSKGCIFATGTPISNSMSELYIMQSYLQRDLLKAKGLNNFDAWASCFGETQLSLELAPEGKGYQTKTRFAKFFNLPELMNMFKEIADIKTAESLNLPVPKANYHTIAAEASDFQKEMVDGLAERADKIRKKQVTSEVDNMLRITNDGRKLALDQRLMNEMLPDYENSKVNECVKNVYKIWEDTVPERSTQLIFCDQSTPKNDGSFNVYDDIKNKLISKGVPENEIAFIHSCKNDEQKQSLFTKVRNGEIRVLLGSTSKMGTGTNCQKKLKALHHIDCPYRPSDLEQRNGRIIRQGNENAEVDIFNYVTKSTFDAYIFQLVENKQRFISQIMTDKSPARSAEDIDESVLSYAQIKALAAGNPKIEEKMNLDIEVIRLRTIFGSYQDNKRDLQVKITKTYPEEIQNLTERIKGIEKDISIAKNNYTDTFSEMTVDGKIYTDKKAAGTAFLESCRKLKQGEKEKPIGRYKGFDMSASFDSFKTCYNIILKNNISYTIEIGNDIFGNITRIDNALDNLPQKCHNLKNKLEEVNNNLRLAKLEVDKPFSQLSELREKESRLKFLNLELSMENKEVSEEKEKTSEEKFGEKNNRNIEL